MFRPKPGLIEILQNDFKDSSCNLAKVGEGMNSRNPEIIRVLYTQGKGLACVKVELVNVVSYNGTQ